MHTEKRSGHNFVAYRLCHDRYTKKMENIARSELNKISYLNVPDEKHRPVPLFPCYHGNGIWELWIPQNNKLVKLAVTKMIEGKYFAKKPESNEDLFLPSIDFLVQRAYWKNIYYFIDSLADDLLNLGTSLKKIEVFHISVEQYQGSAFCYYRNGIHFYFMPKSLRLTSRNNSSHLGFCAFGGQD
jgi:hypothetical protein